MVQFLLLLAFETAAVIHETESSTLTQLVPRCCSLAWGGLWLIMPLIRVEHFPLIMICWLVRGRIQYNMTL